MRKQTLQFDSPLDALAENRGGKPAADHGSLLR